LPRFTQGAARVLDRIAEQADAMRSLSEFTPPATAAQHWPPFVEAIRLVRNTAVE
jgi:hypothetical protein